MDKLITSAHNDTIKSLARLAQSARERRQAGKMVLEGIHLTESALASGIEPDAVYLNADALAKPEVIALVARLGAGTSQVHVSAAVLAKVSSLASAPELIAVCARPVPAPAAPTCSRLLLEDIQDPGNLGTILRSAAAADVRHVFLSRGCVDVFSPKVLRAGMGAHFSLALHEAADLPVELAGFGGRRLVTHLSGASSLYAQDMRGPIALVLGNEGAGVSDALLAHADARILIPMPGVAESLNVAMAATICLFERVRQQQSLPDD